jgi:hypothetical protein
LPTLRLIQGEAASLETQEVSNMRILTAINHSAQAIAEGALIALLVVGLMAGTAFAGGRGGSGAPSRTTATLTAQCPCSTTSAISFTGSGFDGTKALAMLSFNGATTSTGVSSSGTISHSWPYFTQPGTYWVKAYQSGKGGKMTLKAETTVTVE